MDVIIYYLVLLVYVFRARSVADEQYSRPAKMINFIVLHADFLTMQIESDRRSPAVEKLTFLNAAQRDLYNRCATSLF